MRPPVATVVLVFASLLGGGWALGADPPKSFAPEQLDFFEKQVRPLLAANCLACHGPQKQEGGLRLDTREAVLRGGESGPAAVAGNAQESRLVQAIRREGDLKMPPPSPLRPEAAAALTRWVELGLPWPEGVAVKGGGAWEGHRAFLPVGEPPGFQGGGGGGPLPQFVVPPTEGKKIH